MFATPAARLGSICGWSPSNDHPDALYTTIPSPSDASTSQLTLPPSPSSSTPRALRNRNPIPRSLSLDSDLPAYDEYPEDIHNISRFKNATSLRRYRAKRSKDPNWAPRPPNAFILFRRDFVEKHKGQNLSSAEKKTLSKRAGEAWRALTTDEQKAYFDAAKAEADEHLRRNPGYQFRPVKHSRSESRRHPALLSRREQVEEFIRQTSRRRALSSRRRRDQCPTPGSATTPEPPGTPSSQHSAPHLDARSRSQSRSDSIPPPAFPLTPGSEDERGYFIAPQAQSTPNLVPDRPLYPVPKRTWSYSYTGEIKYSPWEYVDFDDAHTKDADSQSINSFDSSVPSEPSPVAYVGDTSPQQMSPNEFGAQLQMPEPMFMPHPEPAMPAPSSTSSSYMPPSSGPLFERRRRAATMSMVPSPLTVVTSSLSNWSRDDLVTARMVPRPDAASAPPSHPPSAQHPAAVFMPQIQVTGADWSQTVHDNNLLMMPIPQVDLDRTPRAPMFAQNAQDPVYTAMPIYPPPEYDFQPQPSIAMMPQEPMSMPVPAQEDIPFDITADIESYQLGLRTYGIDVSQPEPYGAPLGYEAVDYSSYYCHVSPQEQQS
ncbi:hypothetical protein L226DRAFT_614133 [Lentinus tigrinus ALCF2SS1-7]|uniref:HMG box domain-containing protein n=1 Tax=Lentinus tigrinus ALCF2SS1-6 TaxID=1328759 RepID=A0A5C2S8A7_9APHY|nr:hypothetical protein L227DRAFT_612282 [Lentinus tigrinus ALCF2SS1-6]RPD73640.1 hypothetical protein L226DRAFT_614133 [Lentinus tigrinus ALCF2SS1-7]